MISIRKHQKPDLPALGKTLAACLLGSLLAGAVQAGETQADDPHAHHKQPAAGQELQAIDPHAQHKHAAAAQAQSSLARVDLPQSAALLDQHGAPVDLRADVIGDKVVVVNFVYTNCTTVCPVTSSIFSMVQQHLGEQVGKDVALVTITVDPVRDTPHRMMSYAKNFNPGAGWSWLTGEKRIVDEVLDAFGAYTVNFEDHPAMVLVGDDSRDTWYRLYGFPAPEAIESRVRELLDKRSS
ncbi:MAG: SCO family protein [Gammaproteobacteria bacterium]|nr:SCO family protein [Gammaproteobacteria bacterium]